MISHLKRIPYTVHNIPYLFCTAKQIDLLATDCLGSSVYGDQLHRDGAQRNRGGMAEYYAERDCDSRAGNKHHLTKNYLIHLKQSVMEMCHRENLHQVDLLTPAERKVTEKEYWAKRRGQENMDKRNKQMLADGVTPRNTTFQTQKDYLRSLIDAAAGTAKSQEEFKRILLEKSNIRLKVSRGRFSYLHPERSKYITGRALGTHYEEDYLLKLFEENAAPKKAEKKQDVPERYDTETDSSITQDSILEYKEPLAILFVKSDLRLVIDLQDCVKAQPNAALCQ